MTKTGFFRLFWFLSLVWMPAYAADAPRVLTWEDLVVALPPAENPFASLSVEQLDLLADVGVFRDRKARGEKLDAAYDSESKPSAATKRSYAMVKTGCDQPGWQGVA